MKTILFLSIWIFSVGVFGQKVPEKFFFTPDLSIKTLQLFSGDKVKIFVNLSGESVVNLTSTNFLEQYQVRYAIKEDFAAENYMTSYKLLPLNNTQVQTSQKNTTFYFDLEKLSLPFAVLVLDVTNITTAQTCKYIQRIYFAKTKLREEYAVFKENSIFPSFDGFVLEGENFAIKSLNNASSKLYVTHFQQDESPALPPMVLKNSPTSSLKLDTSFVINSNEVANFKKKGLYLIRQDTTAYFGLGLRVEPQNYPKLTQKEQLVGPLMYISSNEEIKSLQNAQNIKKELDRYWLKMLGGDVKRAKNTIKEYYQRIKEANQLFGGTKEGWKTDMGMIYVVFGKPNEIVLEKDVQRWVYTGGKAYSKINFSFLRKLTPFTDENFILIRYVEYENVWYPLVTDWRQGNIK